MTLTNRIVRLSLLACSLSFTQAAVADSAYDDALAIRETISRMTGALVARDSAAFVQPFVEDQDAALYDDKQRIVGKLAIGTWMKTIIGVVPENDVFLSAIPRVLVRPDGETDAAWATLDWQWSQWQGRAVGHFLREHDEWRVATLDFFGMTLLQPDLNFDPQPIAFVIESALAPSVMAVAAVAQGDPAALAPMLHPDFHVEDPDGNRFVGADALQLIGETPLLRELTDQQVRLDIAEDRAIVSQTVQGVDVSALFVNVGGEWKVRTFALRQLTDLGRTQSVAATERLVVTWGDLKRR